MIFAALGTMDMDFRRMARAVDNFAASANCDVIVQSGHTKYDYKFAKSFDFCTKDEMLEYLDRADVVILQGGWGAISEAMSKNKRIVAMPRYDICEHIHDQFQLIKKLDSLGCVIGIFDENELAAKIKQARSFDFKQLKKGCVEPLIRQKLNEWFAH
ncbi:MAG: glycosyltransferase [Rikenellaceae bacterium]